MAKIFELSPHVADLIAAGEVVERPASVIKELMENAIDAGATQLTVEIKNGGMTYMRVTDNGGGIAAEDAAAAFLRHATSKLRDARGLEAISTLGFRGEALAAIAAVSRIALLTRETGADEGTSLLLEGGVVTEQGPAGCPEGTTMIVRDLFFNTPARLKFMKSDRAEGAAVSAAVIAAALSHPAVSVKYIKDGKTECHTPGDGRVDSCVYSVFGREFALGLLAAEGSGDGVAVSGFVSSPGAARGNRSYQYFFVNGRPVKSKTLQAALEQAYRNCLFTGRFPACVLYLTVSHGSVDVNVHPAKTEVKFQNEKQVFDAVYYAALGALERETGGPEIRLTEGTRAAMDAHPGASIYGAPPPLGASAAPGASHTPGASPGPARGEGAPPRREAGAAPGGYASGGGLGFTSRVPDMPETHEQLPIRDETLAVYHARYARPLAGEEDYRLIGEALSTYILVERGDSLWLIDKHAAHERVHFDRLRAEAGPVMAEPLLAPLVLQVGAEDASAILENAALFSGLGFSVDQFSETAVALRAVPSIIDLDEAESAFGELCEKLRRSGTADLENIRDEMLHTVACKAAIKAGRRTEEGELHTLVERVLSGEVKYCPHGRPVAVELTKGQLDRSFKRA